MLVIYNERMKKELGFFFQKTTERPQENIFLLYKQNSLCTLLYKMFEKDGPYFKAVWFHIESTFLKHPVFHNIEIMNLSKKFFIADVLKTCIV